MSKRITLLGIVAVLALAVTGSGLAAKGGGGNTIASISFAATSNAAVAAPSTGSQVSFAVTANVKPSQVYFLWVANVCSQNGVAVSAAYQPVLGGLSGPFTLPASGLQCTASVVLFPDVWTALSGGTMTYSVSG